MPVIKERDSNIPPTAAPIKFAPKAVSLSGVFLKEWIKMIPAKKYRYILALETQ